MTLSVTPLELACYAMMLMGIGVVGMIEPKDGFSGLAIVGGVTLLSFALRLI